MTIGIPAFVLALAPNLRRYIPGFVHRVLRFAVPAGLATGLAAYAGFRLTRLFDASAGVDGGRTTATLIVLIVSLWTVLVLARPLTGWKLGLVATMAGVVALIVTVPALATDVFLLHPTPMRILRGRCRCRRLRVGRGQLPNRCAPVRPAVIRRGVGLIRRGRPWRADGRLRRMES